jgi:hypothetical protein
MKRIFSPYRFLPGLALLLGATPVIVADQTPVQAVPTTGVAAFSKADRAATLPPGWQVLNLGGAARHTDYALVEDQGTTVLRAVSEGAASALVYPLRVDLAKTPIVQWRWKVENVLSKGDALQKDGDDYPARLYIFFDVDASELSWFEKFKYEAFHSLYGSYPPLAAINYLWANKQPVGSLLPNVYSERVQMYVVRSGKAGLGQWLEQERNIYADYVRAFGKTPPMVTGIAVMTDTDNTGESATAYYGDIRLLPEQQRVAE